MIDYLRVIAGNAYVGSNISYLIGTGGDIQPLIGPSKHATNGTVLFETPRFSIR